MPAAIPQNPSFVLHRPGVITFEDRPIPVPGPRDVLVHIQYTGICGSDVHYWSHGSIGRYVVESPMVLGHESSGIIVDKGSEVTQRQIGDRVALEPGIPCRDCHKCKSGSYNLCLNMRFAATPPIDGTLTRYYCIPQDFCYKLEDHVSLEEGALVEPLSIAVHIVRQAKIKIGQTVVIFGVGPIGLLCCAVSRAFGASVIVGVDVNKERLAFAKDYAATHVFESPRLPAEDVGAAIISECKLAYGADVTIDASGAEPCIQAGIHVLKTGGTYVQAGLGKPSVSFPIGTVCDKEVTIKGSFRYGFGDYELATALLNDGKVSVKELITGCYPFEEAEDAFKAVQAATGIKVLIRSD